MGNNLGPFCKNAVEKYLIISNSINKYIGLFFIQSKFTGIVLGRREGGCRERNPPEPKYFTAGQGSGELQQSQPQ